MMHSVSCTVGRQEKKSNKSRKLFDAFEKKRNVKHRRAIKQSSFSIAAMLFDPFFFFDKQSIVETSRLLFLFKQPNRASSLIDDTRHPSLVCRQCGPCECALMPTMGHKKRVVDLRNGLQKRSDGDKSYRVVEHSPNFHKLGSTLPLVNFGQERDPHAHEKRRVPMSNETVPIVEHHEFVAREQQREYQRSIDQVVQLDRWKPAQRVAIAFKVFDDTTKDKSGGNKYRPRVR